MLADIDNPLASRRSVLLYVSGSFHFPLIEPMVRDNQDVEFFLHSNLFGNGEVVRANLNKYGNFHFVSSLDELKFKLDRFGAFITTDAEPANPHSYSLRLVEFFQAIKVPVFELQHGLFQLGLHYFDVPAGFRFGGDSLPAKSFAGQILTYYPPAGVNVAAVTIGYPPYAGRPQPSSGHDWTLVLTNLHWPTYTDEERRAFYESVYRLAAEGPSRVVWKQHHGEIGSSACTALRKELSAKYPLAAKRLCMHHEDASLKELGLDALIARATCVVSTVSTVLLDCEMQQKGVALYGCPSVECLTRRIAEKDLFGTYDALCAILKKGAKTLVTGCLHPYDNAVFRKSLDGAYCETTLSRPEFLTALFTLMQPLNSELRWHLVTLKKSVERGMAEICEGFEARDEKLRAALVCAERKSDSLSTELESLRQKEREGVAALAASESREQALSRECDRLRESLADRGQKTDSLRVELNAALRREKDVLLRLSEAEKRAAVAVSRKDAVEARLPLLVTEINRVRERNVRYEREDNELRLAYHELLGKYTAAEDCLKKCDAQVVALRTECDNLRAERDNACIERADRAQRVEGLKAELAACKSQQAATSSQLDEQRRMAANLDSQLKNLMAVVVDERERRRPVRRIKALVKGVLPYGVVCAWQRMVYGSGYERPLFAYPGVFKRMKRIVKFSLPYGLVKIYRDFKGK